MTERLVNKVSSEIPFIVKRHTESRDRNGVAKEVEQLVTSEVNKLLADVLKVCFKTGKCEYELQQRFDRRFR